MLVRRAEQRVKETLAQGGTPRSDDEPDTVKFRQKVYDDWGFGNKHSYGRGLGALFSGPPGTGKTMVAGIMARELDMELFRIDLSRVVSKWIGETEKNLGKVFDEAALSHAIILFDEADSLFGRRTIRALRTLASSASAERSALRSVWREASSCA